MKLWHNLASTKLNVANNPRMLCSDFNIVKIGAKKWGLDKLNSYEVEFEACLNDLEVFDLNFCCCFYTWTNKSGEPCFVARKLDMVMVNENWMSNFDKTIVDFLNRGC
jgi:hypothetical protein